MFAGQPGCARMILIYKLQYFKPNNNDRRLDDRVVINQLIIIIVLSFRLRGAVRRYLCCYLRCNLFALFALFAVQKQVGCYFLFIFIPIYTL